MDKHPQNSWRLFSEEMTARGWRRRRPLAICEFWLRFIVMRARQTLIILLTVSTIAVAGEEYTLTNITDWTTAQLAALPHFDRYVPVVPAGATVDFTAVCANGLGLVAGNRSGSNGDDGAVVTGGSQTNIGAWGTWYWSYWMWDGQDNHYYSGTVERSPARAANVFGQVLGYANLGGGSSDLATRNDWNDHIYLYDSATGEKQDLTPTAHRCDGRDINDRGEVTGYWSDTTANHPFRRSADGTFTDFVFNEPYSQSIAPAVINNHGHVAGLVTVWSTPRDYIPFLSEAGSATSALPYPDQANAYNAGIADINDHDVIVGYYHKADTPLETTALRWTKQNGNWVAAELTELLVDNMGFILDRAIAVNDAGHIICSGHADGGPDNSYNTHRFLLTPLSFPAPAVATLTPTQVASGSATLRAKVNAANLATTGMFQHGLTAGYGTDTPIPPTNGTLPTLVQQSITGLSPHTTYHYRASGSNSTGATYGADESFTTAWDWSSWAAAHLGTTDTTSDSNGNGVSDLIDYATDNGPPLSATLEAGKMKVTFHRLRTADGITLIVQVSDDLISWTDGSSYSLFSSTGDTAVTTEVSRAADGSETEWVTVAIDSPTARFVRLKVLMQ
jgi:hypothetical protein